MLLLARAKPCEQAVTLSSPLAPPSLTPPLCHPEERGSRIVPTTTFRRTTKDTPICIHPTSAAVGAVWWDTTITPTGICLVGIFKNTFEQMLVAASAREA